LRITNLLFFFVESHLQNHKTFNIIFLDWSDIWEKKGLVNTEDLYLLNGWEKTKFNPEEFIKHIKIILKISDIDKIIEIGCGSGLLSLHFNKDNYIGIDKSLSLINKNIKILKNTVLNFLIQKNYLKMIILTIVFVIVC
jgi:tRNA G46 methylase TrmB